MLTAFKAGDPKAMEHVFRTYARVVLHMVRRGTGRVPGQMGQDEEDLVHEVFSRVFKDEARARYTGLVPFSAYLRGFVRLVLLESHRPQREELADGVKDDATALDGWEPGQPLPEEWLLTQEQIAQVQRFKAGLTEAERTLIETRFEQGLSQRDAAEHLSLTRQIVRRAEDKLVRRFTEFLEQIRAEP